MKPNPDPLAPLLTLVQLSRRARDAASPEALGFVMVNETRQLLSYRQAALWSGGGLLGRIDAVSGLPAAEATAPYVQWLATLCRQVEKSDEARKVHAIGPDTLPALAEDWQQWLPPFVLWLPIQRGALLLARETLWTPHEQGLAGELAHAYQHALAAFAPRQSWKQRLAALFRGASRRRKWLLALFVLCIFPVHLTVLAPAEVSPRDPFVVRAPLAGVIDQVHVRPNQSVDAGALLVNLDATALEARYNVARRAQATAEEEYRQAAQLAVTDDKGKLALATRRGELEARDVELGYTGDQLDRIQVRAPRKGVAVFADVNDWTGKAVSVGEKIMVLADPATVELTIQMPAANAINLEAGSRVRLYPDGSPLSAYDATLSSVAYRAEPTESQVLAYRVKASFAPGQPLPRLGTQGTAKLYGSWVPLAYYALRRPLTSARQWLGW